jgi:hypothetical protein
MDDRQLDDCLHSTGKGSFVKYYEMFSDNTRQDDSLMDILMKNENYTEGSSRTKVSRARSIIRAGRGQDALKIIAKSAGVPSEIRDKARLLLQDCF